MGFCLVEGCEREAQAAGYCGAHYQRKKAKGDPGPAQVRDRVWKIAADAVCSVEGCCGKVEKKTLCSAHYQRMKAYGTPTGLPESRKMNVHQVLGKHVKIGGYDECWPWQSSANPKGYGTHVRIDGEQLAHRSAYRVWVGPIPDGLCVLHHCDNPICCNPKHLFLGDNNDNTQDMIRKGRSKSFGRPRSLQPDDVRLIRDKNQSINDLIIRFDISKAMIGLIRARKVYKDVD
jgi:hypothetical protein